MLSANACSVQTVYMPKIMHIAMLLHSCVFFFKYLHIKAKKTWYFS